MSDDKPADSDAPLPTGEDEDQDPALPVTPAQADRDPKLVKAARLARSVLPGDKSIGDPLSSTEPSPAHQLARKLTEREERTQKPSVMRELGLGALQAWQALSESQGRGRGEVDLAVFFCDLVDFSEWALSVGDETTLRLLREFKIGVEDAMNENGGELVKLLGDGAMAVFREPRSAVDAAAQAIDTIAQIEVDGYSPELRAGVHVGRPRRVGRDYVGVDVNVAARVCDAAGAGEVLISESTSEQLPEDGYQTKRKRFFRAKGAPKDLAVYSVTRA